MLKIGTLFSGGLAAVEWAMKYEKFEHEIVFACEWDKYARKQYLAFHEEPASNFYEDVSDMKGHKYLNAIDLMVWGSPCQDLSLAGKREGFNGEKSSLFREGARIMSEVMPKAFIFENVKGLLSSNGGADYKEVEKTFRELGYHMAMKVVNAKDQGTAQNRERVFVVGFLDLDDYHNFSFADSVPLTKVLRDYLEDEVDEKYYLSEKMIKGFILHKERHIIKHNNKIKNHFVPTDGYKVASSLTCKEGNVSTSNYLKIPHKVGFINQDTQASSVFTSDGVSPSLCSGAHGYTQGYILKPKLNQVGELDIKGSESLRRVYGTDGLCPTMTTMGGGGNRQPKVLLPTIEVGVKSATKSGYEVATENDSINFTHPGSETRRGRVGHGVAQTLDCSCNQGVIVKDVQMGAIRGRNPDNPKSRVAGLPTEQMLEMNENGTANCLTTVGKDNVVVETKILDIIPTQLGNSVSRGNSAFCLRASEPNGLIEKTQNAFRIRRLIPLECGLLMGMRKEDVKIVVSDTQAYKIFGNGIEINSIGSIVRQMYRPVKSSLSLF